MWVSKCTKLSTYTSHSTLWVWVFKELQSSFWIVIETRMKKRFNLHFRLSRCTRRPGLVGWGSLGPSCCCSSASTWHVSSSPHHRWPDGPAGTKSHCERTQQWGLHQPFTTRSLAHEEKFSALLVREQARGEVTVQCLLSPFYREGHAAVTNRSEARAHGTSPSRPCFNVTTGDSGKKWWELMISDSTNPKRRATCTDHNRTMPTEFRQQIHVSGCIVCSVIREDIAS
jgi:hypothetical protein